ncbi:hypothetical protein ISF6_0173 [Piscinibacter sakaiensis]|uniref:Uncharacterized protein n=2 Tax=Piscinibacter sakaiensis TaxID=1547922 RepID=A0A0K8NWW8_PISS1|nr:hypothetical protein ISF6_0173 [Piscinibacter sakaiensis]
METEMQRRPFLFAAAASLAGATPLVARAHHGWGSFDATQPIYLEGVARRVTWRNPHAELLLEVASPLALPADLAQRPVPAQTASVDGRALLSQARLPRRSDRQWQIELAPLSRMSAWQVKEIQAGDRVAVLGYTFPQEAGEAILRVEVLWSGGGTYALRSSPA